MSELMRFPSRESHWDYQKESLKKVRKKIASGDKRNYPRAKTNGRSPLGHYNKSPVNGQYTRSPPGRHNRTPPSQLPRLNGSENRRSPSLRGERYGRVPPVQPRHYVNPGQNGYDSWEEAGDSDDSDVYPSNPYPQTNPYPTTFPYPVYMPPSVLYPGQPMPVMMTSQDPTRTYPARNKHKKKVRYKNTPTNLEEHRPGIPPGPGLYGVRDQPVYSSPQFTYITPQTYPFTPAVYPAPVPDSFLPGFVEDFIHECLEESLVPDILIEALTPAQQTLEAARLNLNEASRDVANRILDDDVNELSREVVIEASTQIADSYLNDKLSKRDPISEFVEEIINDVVFDGATYLAKQAIVDLSESYLDSAVVNNAVNEVINEEIQEKIPDVVRDAIFDVILEDIIEEDYILPEVTENSEEVAVEVLQHYDEKKQQKQQKQILEYCGDRLVDSFCLDYLLGVISKQKLPWTQSDHLEHGMDYIMLEILIGQFINVGDKRRATIEHKPLRRLHEKMVADVASDVLLAELCQSLDEDFRDLDEYEQGYELPEFGPGTRIPTRLNKWLTGL